MLYGALLILTWLVLVIRYPRKALPVSLVALGGLLLIAVLVFWQQEREERALAHVEIRLQHDLQQCPANRPLRVELHNGSGHALTGLSWTLQVRQSGQTANLVQGRGERQRHDGPGNLLADARWESCLALPALRPGYRPESLEYRAIELKGRLAD